MPTEYNLFDFDAYFRNPIEREYTATNCLTGQAEYLTDYGTDRRYLMNVGMASSALPGATPAVVINGIPYADGGVAEIVEYNPDNGKKGISDAAFQGNKISGEAQ